MLGMGKYGARELNYSSDIDLIILDMKAYHPDRHRLVTGMDNEGVLTFARRLAELKRPTWLRYVLVPGLTDDPAVIAAA